MHDWDKYIERPIVEVRPELEAEGYRVTNDECAIYGFRSIFQEKGDVVIEVLCVLDDYDEYDKGNYEPKDDDWWVDDIFENDESFREYCDSEICNKDSDGSNQEEII